MNFHLAVLLLAVFHLNLALGSGPIGLQDRTICEHQSQVLRCPYGKVIWIKKANYGRTDRTTCLDPRIRTTKCYSENSLQKIGDRCDGKNTCTVRASNSVFGDPCYGTFKYVDLTYFCYLPANRKITICEGNTDTISCPYGEVILVQSAFYGRKERVTCPSHLIRTTSCNADASGFKIKKACDGKHSCTVAANNHEFGDPCEGTVKYVEVTYTCFELD